jgi:hypothetical protein
MRGRGAQSTVLGVLYHISLDDKHKPQFALTECIAVAMRLLLAGGSAQERREVRRDGQTNESFSFLNRY